MITTVIIDDERKARETMVSLLSDYCPDVEVVAQANSVESGCEAILQNHPDIVFLDIEMLGGNGFDLLEKLEKIDFEIVFTTAYGHYAIKAFRFSALDYLLKPVDIDELQNAIARCIEKRQKNSNNAQKVKTLLGNIKSNNSFNKVAIPDLKGLTYINMSDIIRCQADKSYTLIYVQNGDVIVSTRILKEYEMMFEEENFFRVHHSHLINIAHIKRYQKGEGGQVIMSDDTEIDVSRRRKISFLEKLKEI